jgi:hypothetical protein
MLYGFIKCIGYFCNISLKVFPQMKVMHIQILWHEDHSHLLIIDLSNTACISSIEFSARRAFVRVCVCMCACTHAHTCILVHCLLNFFNFQRRVQNFVHMLFVLNHAIKGCGTCDSSSTSAHCTQLFLFVFFVCLLLLLLLLLYKGIWQMKCGFLVSKYLLVKWWTHLSKYVFLLKYSQWETCVLNTICIHIPTQAQWSVQNELVMIQPGVIDDNELYTWPCGSRPNVCQCVSHYLLTDNWLSSWWNTIP